jgi:hypothetical protein
MLMLVLVVFAAAISWGRARAWAWKERIVEEGPVDSTFGCRRAATTASLLIANILMEILKLGALLSLCHCMIRSYCRYCMVLEISNPVVIIVVD